MKKSDREIMEILEAFDVTGCAHSAAALAGVDPKTVRRYVAAREAGVPVMAPVARSKVIDSFVPKIEELIESSKGKVRAASVTNATYTHPLQVETYVRSATQSRSGAVGATLRPTRSRARSAAGSPTMVVRLTFPRTAPARPCAFMSRSHGAPRDRDPFPIQRQPHLPRPVHPVVRGVDPTDLFQ